jgi:hypothetical protein
MTKDANHPKTAQEMYADLAGITEGGSLYTLQRTSPFTVEYLEQISRTSKDDPDESRDQLFVYLSSSRGKEFRIHVDCADNTCKMEHNPEEGWKTYSTALSGFRYRSPSHPEHGEPWEY